MLNPTIQGVLPVISTPFTNSDQIDDQILEAEVNWLYDQGVDGIVMGMVSEVMRLTDVERDHLVERVMKATRGRGVVVSSVGAESTAQAIRHARAAECLGVNAHMAIPPALTRCSSEEIYRYYSSIIQATEQPIIIQDASGYIGNSIPISLQAQLFLDFPDRVLFKPEAQPIGSNLSALRKITEGKAPIFEGTGGIALVDSFKRGVSGTMPGSDLPWAIVALWRALQQSNWTEVRQIQGPLTAIISQMNNLDAFLVIEKMLLKEQGVFVNTLVRGPVGYVLDEETRLEILWHFAFLKEACHRPEVVRS